MISLCSKFTAKLMQKDSKSIKIETVILFILAKDCNL